MTKFYLPDTLPDHPGLLHKVPSVRSVDGCATVFHVVDDEGRLYPFTFQQDTRRYGLTGFVLKQQPGVMTWQGLLQHWPEFLRRNRHAL